NGNGKLTNNGTIIVEKGGNLTGNPGGKVVYAPAITTQPQDVEVKENETATFTVEAIGTDLSYQWQQSTDNGNSWTNIASATSDTYTTGKTTMSMNGYQYRCVVKNNVNEVVSNAAMLKVTHNLQKVEAKEPTCTDPGNIAYWYCSACKKYFKDEQGKVEIRLEDTVIPALGHKYGEPSWEWANDNTAKAVFKCEKGDDSKTLSGIMSSKVTKDATCDAKGIRTYSAKVTFGGKEYTASKDVEIPALSCNSNSGNDQPYDDGGPFTRNECGDVFDRWGNLIYDAPDCVVKPKPTTSPQTTTKPQKTTETTLEPVKTEEPTKTVEPEKTTTPKPSVEATSTPDSDVKVEKENSFGFIWWILGGIGVAIVGVVVYLVVKNNQEE
ncbi:MAG: immunoglobulin domain-containing protein, partial [Erysipelotrichaceae bacterium]|nr:immunoglobulin domain-containing protein [Erysipelotrichaceae bacterium]